MTDSAVEIDRLSNLQPERFVHLRVEFYRAFKNDCEFVAFVSEQVFEFIERSRMQFHHYRRKPLANQILSKIAVSINSSFDDKALAAALNAAAPHM
jgi:hypothetical protein